MQCVCCIMYIKNIYFVHNFMYLKYNSLLLANVQRIDKDYTQYTIHLRCMLCVKCLLFSVFAIHYTEYIVNI